MINDKKRIYMKKYSAENREKIRENQRKYDARRRRDPERAAYMKKYAKNYMKEYMKRLREKVKKRKEQEAAEKLAEALEKIAEENPDALI